MPEALVLILIFISWIVIAAVCHSYIKNYLLAAFIAACVMVAVAQIASYIELGHMDPFWLISSVTGFFMASIIALIVGIPIKLKRGINREDI